MVTRFEKNDYYYTSIAKTRISLDSPLENLFFDDQVTYAEFKEKNNHSRGWLTRKLVAIPYAFWSGVVKTIHHLYCVVFHHLPVYASERKINEEFKIEGYRFARDLQEAGVGLSLYFMTDMGLI